jgi:hypothetical protein
MQTMTSLILLFSVGTFLYVSAIHIIPEVFSLQNRKKTHFARPVQVCALLVGLFSPTIFYTFPQGSV